MLSRMLRFVLVTLLVLCLCAGLTGCGGTGNTSTDDTKIYLNMNTDYGITDSLADGEGKHAKVILLLGRAMRQGAL